MTWLAVSMPAEPTPGEVYARSSLMFQPYKCEGDRRLDERLVETHRPMVSSVCRRWLRDPNDVEDVVQETFLKLAGHIHSLNGSIPAWLAATAQAGTANFIRREVRERNRRRGLALILPHQQRATHEAIRLRLHDALLAIDPAARELLTARFVLKHTLRVIAARLDVSVPTVSRQLGRALKQLAEVLRDMGVLDADDRTVVDHFGAHQIHDWDNVTDHGDLRFAPDWRCAELSPLGAAPLTTVLPGCSRPLRVGAFLGYSSTLIKGGPQRKSMHVWQQVQSTPAFPQAGVQLVGVVEPGTIHRGVVECTMRDYGIIGGLIEADDVIGLQSLDVLLLGMSFAMSSSIARAISLAVRSGMGLLNEYWVGTPGDDPAVRELMLADSTCYPFHMPGQCGSPLPATVLREHPLLPGLRRDTRLSVAGCGPAYRVVPGAQVLITKDHQIGTQQHRMSNAGPLELPCYIVGQLGRGRVVANHIAPTRGALNIPFTTYDISHHLNITREQYFINLLRWLAGSRDKGS
jgi:RNA polymerase sigma factor (sigma-70 family)